MSVLQEPSAKILIVGGGISGLAAAVRLTQLAQAENCQCQVKVVDRLERWGGLLDTQYSDDGLVELCADMFTTKLPWAYELCRSIGFTNQLIPTVESRRGALVATPSGSFPVPAGFSLMVPQRWDSIWKTPLLTRAGKMRMWFESRVADKPLHHLNDPESDESFANFTIRHWGREAYERLIQPLVSGIFTADPEKLSMAAALSEFLDLERKYGSLKRAGKIQSGSSKRQDSTSTMSESHLQDVLAASSDELPRSPVDCRSTGVRYGLFLTPKHGMKSWIDAIVNWLKAQSVELQTRTSVTALSPIPDGWQVQYKIDSGNVTSESFSQVILALPAHQSGQLVQSFHPELVSNLLQIEHASAAIVVSRYRKAQFTENLDKLGFGLVVPNYLDSPLIAASFASQKFGGRCDEQHVIIRSFFGGALHPEHLEWPDGRLIETSATELKRWLPLAGTPQEAQVIRWRCAMPQYHVGHRQRIKKIESLTNSYFNFALAGNSYHGVGIPQCIKSGWDAAEKIWPARRYSV